MSAAGEVRRAMLAMLALALLASAPAHAQDPRAVVVQTVARQWLALADKLDAEATWNAAGVRFQQTMTIPQWADGLKREREARGAIAQRTVVATSFGSSMPGVPEGGNYALVRFRTSFANETFGAEHVTLEMGPDNVWRVIGYVLR